MIQTKPSNFWVRLNPNFCSTLPAFRDDKNNTARSPNSKHWFTTSFLQGERGRKAMLGVWKNPCFGRAQEEQECWETLHNAVIFSRYFLQLFLSFLFWASNLVSLKCTAPKLSRSEIGKPCRKMRLRARRKRQVPLSSLPLSLSLSHTHTHIHTTHKKSHD